MGTRIAQIRQELQALSEESRAVLLTQYAAHLEATNAIPAIKQRVAEGRWQSALVMGDLMRFYWNQTRRETLDERKN